MRNVLPWLLLSGLLTGGLLRGQNLVPNHNFDQRALCPFAGGQITYCRPWFTPNRRTTDFFHTCSAGITNMPANFAGNQLAASGRGYAGIRTYLITPGTPDSNYREYLGVKLTQPLQAGAVYDVRFMVSVAEVSGYYSDDLGACFLGDSAFSDTMRVLPFAPQIQNPGGRLLTDATGWMEVGGQFRARGGERYMAIGNFRPDGATTLQVRPGGSELTVYYYLDDIRVQLCTDALPPSLISASDTVICPGSEVGLQVWSSPLLQVQWADGDTATLRRVRRGGWYHIEGTYAGCQISDSVYLAEVPPANLLAPAPQPLCMNETATLQVRDTSLHWAWTDGEPLPVRTVAAPGVYILMTEQAGCVRFDTATLAAGEGLAGFDGRDSLVQTCLGEALVLGRSWPGATYRWDDGTTDARREVRAGGTYTLELRTTCAIAQQTYTVQTRTCPCAVFVPNVFTPNGDGRNEQWIPEPASGVIDLQLVLYDRWGRLVYQTQGLQPRWQGLDTGGRAVPAGTYFWSLRYTCNDVEQPLRQQAGALSLLR
ncbi:MAG: hypothetical protein OHK0039_31370 [Bacteroidia bacterium]